MSAAATFRFMPRWKEELVVTGPGGQFILTFWMGIPTVCLAPWAEWQSSAPEWARPLWTQLYEELAGWCRENGATLEVAAGSGVYPV
jgi:hypothetical protein